MTLPPDTVDLTDPTVSPAVKRAHLLIAVLFYPEIDRRKETIRRATDLIAEARRELLALEEQKADFLTRYTRTPHEPSADDRGD